ncbi:MAG: type VII secretion protein EssC [Clostridiales bacterium]|nr:type VII secretion protein EssC [Clostridiales bacterium]
MRYIIMAYASGGYQEYLLPETDNADHRILLEQRIFGFRRDVPVRLEIVDGSWSFVTERYYRILTREGQEGAGIPLEDGQIFELLSPEAGKVAMVVLKREGSFSVFTKYHLGQGGQLSIGQDEDNEIVYSFGNYISKHHASLFWYNGKWVLQDASSNGTYLNGRKIRNQVFLTFGDQITLFGLRIIFMGEYLAVCSLSGACLVDDKRLPVFHPSEGLILPDEEPSKEVPGYFKRAPRMTGALYTEPIEIEAPPPLNPVKKRPVFLTIGPSLTMAVPMMLGCMMAVLNAGRQGSSLYMFTGLVTAAASAVLGTFWALMNLKYAGKEAEEQEELRYNAYGRYLIEITEFIKNKYDESRELLYRNYPSGQECCEFQKTDARLWNHNERQPDFMWVRIGTGTIPFQAEIRIPREKFTMIRDNLAEKPALIRDSYQMLVSVPFCIDMRGQGVLGIVGGPQKRGAYGIVRNLIAQMAVNNCYTDVKMVFVCPEGSEARKRWEFAKWLPHVWTEDHRTRLIAGDKAEVGEICYELARILQMRTENGSLSEKKKYPLPHYMIFVDDRELLQGELLERLICSPRPEYGVTTVLLTERYEELPNRCEAVLQNDGQISNYFHVSDSDVLIRDLVCEETKAEQLEQLARRLCDIVVDEAAENGEIPGALSFFEMYGVHSLEQLHVPERWKKNRNYENMRVPIGQKAGGSTCSLDIHEKYHGPHGLVAGTTGSGKSETLQTYILSLAVNFSPDDVAFFVIDFKGGGMANLFSDLPHLAGQISNLSGNQVQRAMISIKSENMRRQRIFAEHNVNNINLYTRLYKNHEAKLPIPHLFIVIDEFAELKREQPEFMKELISVAQVGRSLGVHLILATQKPGGTVDDNIWSNSRFRLCLRVQDRQDSSDMLHKPDAAYITQTGRGYLQVGNDEIYEQFQTGYSGAEYISDPKKNRSAAAVRMTLTGRTIDTGGGSEKKKTGGKKEMTQLEAVVEYLSRTAIQHHYGKSLRLWLPVLPEKLLLQELEEFGNGAFGNGEWKENGQKLEAVIGLYDDPANQAQKPLKIGFAEGGHLAVCGMVAVGKSTFLQTLLYSMLSFFSPQKLHTYILDFSSRLLLPFRDAPHCGGIIMDTELDKVKTFFCMLDRMAEERKKLFQGGNFSQYIQSGCREGVLPAVLVVIDNYAGFRDKTDGRYDDFMLRLSREGVGYGIFLAISSGGFGANEIPTRLGENIRTVLSLEMGDKFKYAETLRTSRVENLPEADRKGRGLAYVNGSILEFQTALAVDAGNAYERSEKIRKDCLQMRDSWKGAKAGQIPVIPDHPVLEDLSSLEEYQTAQKSRRYLPFAYLEQDASVCSVDLWRTYSYVIQGREQSGKTNVMKLLLYAAAKKPDAKLCVIELQGSEMERTARQLQADYVSDGKAVYEFFKNTVPVFAERNQKKQELLSRGTEQEELAEQMNQEERFFIFITDLSAFVQAVYHLEGAEGSIHKYLENISEKGSSHGFYFISCLNPEQSMAAAGYKVYQNLVSYRTGIHLGGNVNGQRIFQFGNIPFQEQGRVTKAGVGLAPSSDDSAMAERLVLPLVRGGVL